MSDDFRIEFVSTEDVTFVHLRGKLNKKARLEAIADAVDRPTVMFNLEGIEDITKEGVTRWRKALALVQPPPETILLTECSPAVVDKLNTDSDFVGDATIVSVGARLHCAGCGRETLVTVEMDQPVSDDTLAFACAECDSPLESEQPIEEYFAFADNAIVASLSEEMQAALIAFENRDNRASIEPGSQEEEELRAAAEAIKAAEAAEAARAEEEEEAAGQEAEKQRKPGLLDGLKAQLKLKGKDETKPRADSAPEASREEELPPATAPAADSSFPDATVVNEQLPPDVEPETEPEAPDDGPEPEVPDEPEPDESEPDEPEPDEPEPETPDEPEAPDASESEEDDEPRAEPEPTGQPAVAREPDEPIPEEPQELAASKETGQEPEQTDDVAGLFEHDNPAPGAEPTLSRDEPTRVSQRALRDDDTDPALKAAQPKQKTTRRRTEPSVRASAPGPEPKSRERTSPAIRMALPRALNALDNPVVKLSAGIAIGCVILVAVVFLLARPSGIPAEDIVAFLDHLEKDQLSEAEVIANEYEGDLPGPLDQYVRRAVQERRRARADTLFSAANTALGAKRYSAALETAERALEIAPGHLDMLYVAGESLRLVGQLEDARPYYYEFVEEAGDDDDRADDALFWQAAALKEAGQLEQARSLCERILEMESSNFRTAASRCAEEAGE